MGNKGFVYGCIKPKRVGRDALLFPGTCFRSFFTLRMEKPPPDALSKTRHAGDNESGRFSEKASDDELTARDRVHPRGRRFGRGDGDGRFRIARGKTFSPGGIHGKNFFKRLLEMLFTDRQIIRRRIDPAGVLPENSIRA